MENKNQIKSVIACFLLAISFIIILRAVSLLLQMPFTENYSYYFIDTLTDCILGILLTVLLLRLGKLHILHEKGIGLWNGLKVGGFLTVYIAIVFFVMLLSGGQGNQILPVSQITFFALAMLGTGLIEEVMFRGVIQNILYDCFGRNSRKSIYQSVAVSAVIFGFMHLSNIFSGVSARGAMIQAVGAMAVGFYFGAIYARSNNIWVTVLLHAFNDFVALMPSGIWGTNSVVDAVSDYGPAKFVGVGLYLALSVFLLRKKKWKEFS